MVKAIEQLRLVVPNWVAIQSSTAGSLDLIAAPFRAGGEPSRQYSLLVEELAEGFIRVRENPVGRLLPAWCPERHINPDESFCLGLNAGSGIDNLDGARRWWRKLELFLDCQEVASSTGRWPPYLQLSHGFAGNMELEAEKLAAKLGLLEEYQRAVRYGTGPIAEAVQSLSEDGSLRNGRSTCICGYTNEHDHLLLRKDCGMGKSDACLIRYEAERQEEIRDFWKTIPASVCCETMEDCPLRGQVGA